jgi:tetratricopeptide (TPR) repeat protein
MGVSRSTGGAFAAVAIVLGMPLSPAVGQFRTPPKRPRLAAIADTNSANDYYNAGVSLLRRDPWTAAAAFYWASRLEPGWSAPYYARRVAGLLAQENLLTGYLERNLSVINSREFRQHDSLEYQAERLDPFFLRDLDEQLLVGYVITIYKRAVRREGERPADALSEVELNALVDQYLRSGQGLWVRAALATSRHRLPDALALYGQLLTQYRGKSEIRIERARICFAVGAYDSAQVELQTALDELRRRDTTRLMPVYVSREMLEHSIGVIHEAAGDTATAREAYGRALQENLSFSPAHIRLGALNLLRRDTTTALSEWALAVELAPTEAPPRVAYAQLLAQTGRRDEAVLQLRQAAAAEPFYAIPQYLLGWVAELQGKRAEALAGYRAFLELASARDRLRPVVQQRVADLGP